MRFLISALLPLAALAAHCGGTVVANQSAGTASGAGGGSTTSASSSSSTSSGPASSSTGSSASTSSSAGTGGASPIGCPAAPPAIGSACGVPGSVSSPPCTYGNEDIPQCRQAFVCADGGWGHADGAFGACPSTAGCPATPPASQSDCSTTTSGYCRYQDGTFCSCGSFAGPVWLCYTPSGGCPSAVPNAGTACSTDGINCGYEGCNIEVSCTSGIWTWGHVAC